MADHDRIRFPPPYMPRRYWRVRIPRHMVNLRVDLNPAGNIWLPPLLLQGSNQNWSRLDPGLGVYPAANGTATRRNVPNAVPAIREGEIVSEYGGNLIDHIISIILRRSVWTDKILPIHSFGSKILIFQGEDTHIGSVTAQHEYLDSREGLVGLNGTIYDIKWYAKFHYLAGFINTSATNAGSNCEFLRIDASARQGMVDNTNARRLFVRATQDIYLDEEFLLFYGTGYLKRHGMI